MHAIFRAALWVGAGAFVILLVTSLLAFEEAPVALLLSAVVLSALPLVIVLHLALTKHLSPGEKEYWWRRIRSRHAPRALADYVATLRRERPDDAEHRSPGR